MSADNLRCGPADGRGTPLFNRGGVPWLVEHDARLQAGMTGRGDAEPSPGGSPRTSTPFDRSSAIVATMSSHMNDSSCLGDSPSSMRGWAPSSAGRRRSTIPVRLRRIATEDIRRTVRAHPVRTCKEAVHPGDCHQHQRNRARASACADEVSSTARISSAVRLELGRAIPGRVRSSRGEAGRAMAMPRNDDRIARRRRSPCPPRDRSRPPRTQRRLGRLGLGW